MTDFIIISTTTDSRDVAQSIASYLVEKKLAACIQIHEKVTSFFRWQKKVEKGIEFSLKIKTKRSLFAKVAEEIKQKHNYTVPQIISVSIDAVSQDYEKWLSESL